MENTLSKLLQLALYADYVVIYALCERTRQHWTACFRACGRVSLRLLWASQKSGGIFPSWQTSFTRDHLASNGNSARWRKAVFCSSARMGVERTSRQRQGLRSSGNCGVYSKRP